MDRVTLDMKLTFEGVDIDHEGIIKDIIRYAKGTAVEAKLSRVELTPLRRVEA